MLSWFFIRAKYSSGFFHMKGVKQKLSNNFCWRWQNHLYMIVKYWLIICFCYQKIKKPFSCSVNCWTLNEQVGEITLYILTWLWETKAFSVGWCPMACEIFTAVSSRNHFSNNKALGWLVTVAPCHEIECGCWRSSMGCGRPYIIQIFRICRNQELEFFLSEVRA